MDSLFSVGDVSAEASVVSSAANPDPTKCKLAFLSGEHNGGLLNCIHFNWHCTDD